ncbi:DDE domain protein [Brucella grignonensis]|uniref:DDE domain protein n=1 Tax=Brucella grignonensis TaxID=94627 RepID=A0A256G341_9HYPH|nr:DDE domain protein [Brucella grignonensis]
MYIAMRQVKYLNNVLEQDHRFIKQIIEPITGFKTFYSTSVAIAHIELVRMTRKNQFHQRVSLTISGLCGTRSMNTSRNKVVSTKIKILYQNQA